MTDTTSTSTMFGSGQFFQKDNYASVTNELTEFDLAVEGTIPPELDGWYLRNGPNPRQTTGHWFTGEGMVHGLRIQKGRAAWYRNRWIRTENFDDYFPIYNGDGTRNLRSSTANTNVINHAGKTLVLDELSQPYEITKELETVGAYDFCGKLLDSMTAHPKICPTTGELHFFGYGSILEPHVSYYRADANGELIVSRPVDVKALTMMHDFAMSAEHVIFMDLPVLFDPMALKPGGNMPFRWDDNYGARLGVIRRNDPYGEVRWFEVDPGFAYHVANAYDEGGKVVVQVVRYHELYRHSGGFDADGVMWSWTIDLASGRVSERQIDDQAVEFPRIDDRRAGLPARYAVTTGPGKLIRYDLSSGSAVEHVFGTTESMGHPGEAIFVPSPNGSPDEDSGWHLVYAYDPVRDGSDLVIIDASDFTGKPVARIKMPQRVPFGLHGNWIPKAE